MLSDADEFIIGFFNALALCLQPHSAQAEQSIESQRHIDLHISPPNSLAPAGVAALQDRQIRGHGR